MSSATAKRRALPREISTRLSRLRSRLTRWLLVDGFSHWLAAIILVLVVDMGLDRLFKMDFAQRSIMLGVMVLFAVIYLFQRVIRPLGNRPGDDALLYEVEAKHADLKESLLSGAQLARQANLEELGASRGLTDATIQQGIEQARAIDFGTTLNQPRYRNNLILMGISAVLLLGLWVGVNQTSFFRTWFNRNILLQNDAWPQGTYLQIMGVEDGQLVLPRGSDHRQLVEVSPDSQVVDVDVTLEIDGPGGKTVHPMKPTGRRDGREHLFVLHNVATEFRLRAAGGDDLTEWVEVKLVEPPSVTQMELKSILPPYTGRGPEVLPGAGPHAVLNGSQLEIRAEFNKPLKLAALRLGEREFVMSPEGDPSDSLVYKILLPTEGDSLAGGQYEFALVDQTGLSGTRPAKFTIKTREDGPPKVRADLLGISGLVVPRARIPVAYNVSDEYGLSEILLDCNWKNSDEDAGRNQTKTHEKMIRKFDEPDKTVNSEDSVDVLDLEPLKLIPGASFMLSVVARDNRPPQANTGRSGEFLLRIVTEQELRDDMLRREIEQRKAFQQAYEAQMELAAELRAVAGMSPNGQTPEQFKAMREERLITIGRDQKAIGTSINAIANRFIEFLVEAKNNRLDEDEQALAGGQTIEQRFDGGIIQPIRRLDSDLIALASRNLDNCRRFVDDSAALMNAVTETGQVHDQILAEMKRILDAMVDSENFQEVVNKLLEIKRNEMQIKTEMDKRNKNEDDIFDDDK
ncbi:MAG: hypothetical protein MK108_16555 [Mariniblastus sp.]|nr:hypothetical protein [Mariniblastus sp.]